jgi:enoyl-CoA hydratase/carnithine racemase
MPVIVLRHRKIAEVRMDWPDVHNALGPSEASELRRSFEELDSDTAPPAVIVLSAAGKSFSAGGNLKSIVDLVEENPGAIRETIYGEFQELFRVIARARVPIVAAVQGPAIGLGCDLALAADIAFIGPKGWLKQGWINVGLIPATGGIQSFVRRAGPSRFWKFLAADRIGPEECEKLGLGYQVSDAHAAALEFAEKLASLPGEALQATRKLSRIDDREEHLSIALDYRVGFLSSPSFRQVAQALLSSKR